MEEKIEIKNETTEVELLNIILNNTAEEVAKAFRKYMDKQVDSWYIQYSRADKAEKELADIKAALVEFALTTLKEKSKDQQA